MPENAPDEVVELRVGDRHEMRLPGLGTAGYRWRPEPEGETNVAEVSPAGTEGTAGGAIGASADELFTIHARRPGSMRLRFAQRRPWEPEDRPAANERIVELRVHNH